MATLRPHFLGPARLRLPVRRPQADRDAQSVALVLGCLIGVAIAWQAVLSDGARELLLQRAAGLVASAGPVAIPDATALLSAPDLPATVDAAALATPTAAPPTALPERLALREETVPPGAFLVLTFALNSSYLSADGFQRLRRFAATLPADRPLRFELAATVSDDPVRGARAGEEQQYHRWLAERRLQRIADWLSRRLGRDVEITRRFIPHDRSRRVSIRVHPVA